MKEFKLGYINSTTPELEFKKRKDINLIDYVGVRVLLRKGYRVIPGIVRINSEDIIKIIDIDGDEWYIGDSSTIAKDTVGLGKIIEQGLL